MEGWKCPNCGRVWGPHVDACRSCNAPVIPCPQQYEYPPWWRWSPPWWQPYTVTCSSGYAQTVCECEG